MNQQLFEDTKNTKTDVGYLPLLNAPADAYATLNQKFKHALHLVDTLQNKYAVRVVDQALFCKAIELKWSHSVYRSGLIVRLGG